MTDERSYPGQRFGLPESGPGSAATWGQRVLALALDWFLCLGVAMAFVGPDAFGGPGTGTWSLLPLLIFLVEASLLTATLGGSIGQVVVGVDVRRTSGARLDPLRSLVRTLLICLVIPAVVFTPDRQGLHDMAADSLPRRRR